MRIVILAAGRGTRLGEAGKKKQKCSFILERNMLLLHELELLDNIIMVVGHNSKDIKEEVKRIKEKYHLNEKISFVKQEEQKGQAHAVYLTKDLIDSDFCVVNGDIFLEKNHFSIKNKKMPIIAVSRVEDPWNYGIISLNEKGKIVSIIEKPEKGKEPSNMAISGIYFFDKTIFSYINKTKPNPEKKNEVFLADTLKLMIPHKEVNYFQVEKPKHLTTEKDLENLSKFLR